MRSLSRSRRLLGLALLVTLATFRSASGQGKDKGEDVHFDTADGVKIEGTFWAGKDGKKSPVALLLHDFKTGKGGGSSHDNGWDNLAAALNKAGFAVLQFDFRGYGKSTIISSPMTFWNPAINPHNQKGFRGINPMKLPETIDYSHFTNAYYSVLANDVNAAKAFLDRKNDGGELNTSNTVLIGAGQGASVGALWLATEFHKKRGVPSQGVVGAVADARLIKFDANYEGKDVRAAIWIGISATIGDLNLPVKQYVTDSSGSKTNKVPTVFIFGKEDKDGDARALSYMKAIFPDFVRGKNIKDNPVPLSGDKAIDKSGLKGSSLLLKSLETESWIVNDYLGNDEMKKSLKEEWRDRDSAKNKQWWLFPPGVQAIPAKSELETYALPLNRFGVPN